MNKNDLVASIMKSAKINRKAATLGLNGLLSSLSAAIKEGKRVSLSGFGSFSLVERAPRTGRNPRTGEKVPIPPRRVVKFRPGRELAVKIQ